MQFSNVTIEWSQNTFIFYLAIIIGCYLLCILLKKKKIKTSNKKIPLDLTLVGLILLLVKCFNTTGRDLRAGYYYNFMSATSMSTYRDQTVEPGFRLLMVIVRNITQNYGVFLFVVGLLTILPVLYFIDKYRDKIDVPVSILLFTSLYFVNGFSAYRQYMAVCLALFAFDAIMEKKPVRALVWIAVCSTIHIACLTLFIPYIIRFAKVLSKRMIAISALLLFAILYLGRGSIAALLGTSSRYGIYLVSQEVSFGFEQIVYYVPLFILVYLCRKNHPDRDFSRVTYIFLITGFAFGMFSYVLPIFGRMQSVFLPIVILIPYYIKLYKNHHNKQKRSILNVASLVYCIARFVIWITQYYNLEDLMPYTNLFNLTI